MKELICLKSKRVLTKVIEFGEDIRFNCVSLIAKYCIKNQKLIKYIVPIICLITFRSYDLCRGNIDNNEYIYFCCDWKECKFDVSKNSSTKLQLFARSWYQDYNTCVMTLKWVNWLKTLVKWSLSNIQQQGRKHLVIVWLMLILLESGDFTLP